MNEWDDLVDRHLIGELSESEKERLAQLLDSDPSLREDFVKRSSWKTELASVLRTGRDTEANEFDSSIGQSENRQGRSVRLLRAMLAIAAAAILMLSLLLFSSLSKLKVANTKQQTTTLESIAQITGFSGSLIWTGDRGQIRREIEVGTKLAGGTIEGLSPDSWFELQFNDGSTVMISGTSMLTFADLGQKELRLREGIFSANVAPQPRGKPMLIHTPSTLLEILGTQFDVEATMTSTVLNVTEGKVRMRRLSDGREVDVPARHRVITEGGGDLTLQSVPDSIDHWKSQLHVRPGGCGKWLPATPQRSAAQKAIPFVPPGYPGTTLYLLGISISRGDGQPVVVRSDSRFVVRGRLDKPAQVHFGIAVSDASGEFAGKFRGDLKTKQPISQPDENGRFEVVYKISDFTLDPCVRDREEELAVKPDDLVLGGIWAFTNTKGPSGLEVTEVELIP